MLAQCVMGAQLKDQGLSNTTQLAEAFLDGQLHSCVQKGLAALMMSVSLNDVHAATTHLGNAPKKIHPVLHSSGIHKSVAASQSIMQYI